MDQLFDAFLFVYFGDGHDADSEQIRFAVTDEPRPVDWKPLAGGAPYLRTNVGEGGARDPFILRDTRRREFIIIATDLAAAQDGDWGRAVRHGSTSILVWRSRDLVDWEGPALVPIAPREAGNAWAPKAIWSDSEECWLVFFASALYPEGSSRRTATHQRIMVARTQDFTTFEPARVQIDPGHDIIDAAFLKVGDRIHRFSADSLSNDDSLRSQHVSQEVGAHPLADDFRLVAHNVDAPELRRGEGPAPFKGLRDDGYYLLVDEFELRGYQLFHSWSPETGEWRRIPNSGLPAGARHGSVLPISAAERERLLRAESHR